MTHQKMINQTTTHLVETHGAEVAVVAFDDAPDDGADFGVHSMPSWHHDERGTQPFGYEAGHSCSDAIPPGQVV